MRVWLDLSNSPHALLFPPIARQLTEAGNTVLVTARDNAQTVELAKRHWPQLKVVGEASPAARVAKAAALAGRVRELVNWARANEIDVALSHNSYSQIVAAAILRVPTVTAMDFEHQPANHVAFRLATRVLLPRALAGNDVVRRQGAGRRVRYYDGFKEEIALGDFAADREVLTRIGIDVAPDRIVVVARTPPSRALYHRFTNPLFVDVLDAISRDPRCHSVVLCRFPEQRDQIARLRLTNCTLPDRAVDSRSLMAVADLVIGAGGTMTREAALLGTPTISVFAGRRSAVDEALAASGRLRIASTLADVIPVRQRTAMPVTSRELRTRGALLVDRFVEVLEEAAHMRRARITSAFGATSTS